MKVYTKLILKAGFLVGTLDITAACLNFYYKTGKNIELVFKYIASAIFGKSAMVGHEEMVLFGLLLHYIIAFCFTIFFSLIYHKLWEWFKNTWLIAFLYGVFVWIVMNIIVVPNSNTTKIPFSWTSGLINCAILIVCIGCPLAFLYRKNRQTI